MPHLTLEHSADLSQEVWANALFPELFQVLVRVANVDIENCKGRIAPRDQVCVGRGEPQNAFVHLEIRLLAGRPAEVEREIGEQCLKFLQRFFSPSAAHRTLQITVEIVEMRRDAYFKVQA
jgi:5-carboxymethyl-2-hydroxymuconate isomerase